MFLQTKYQNQLQKDTRTTFGNTAGFQQLPKKELKHKSHLLAGSIKMGRMNFELGEQIFPKEDIPHKAVEAKKQMTHLVDPDILGLRKKGWDRSVAVPLNAQEEDFDRKLTKIKLGFFDTPLPKYRPPKIEAGTDTRDAYTGWNVSTEPMNKFQKEQAINAQIDHAMEKTKTYFRKIRDYKDPTQTITNFNENLRQTKRDEKELRAQFREKYRFENPAATEERINAGVNRLVYEHKKNLIRPKTEDPMHNQTFKPDLSKTLKPSIGHYAYHNGSWGRNAASPDQEVWSCCMAEKKTGEGCVKVKVNRDKWILDSCGSAFG